MPASLRAPRHLIPRGRFPLVRSLAAAATSIALGTTIALAFSGSSFALWNDAAPVSSTSVTSATLSLTATESFDDSLWTNLLVGEKQRQTFTVTNTGNIPMNLSATATAATGFEVRLARTACTTALTGTAGTAQSTALATLAAGTTATVCIEVTIVTGALPNVTAPIAVTVTGSQQ